MTRHKVLVIEDDRDVRLGYHVLLKANHYETHFAVDSISAISEARKQQPDVIILDLGLPGGDGFTVLERLQAIPSLAVVPVIVVTARAGDGSKERTLKAGANVFLQKPWNDSVLLAIISELIGHVEVPG